MGLDQRGGSIIFRRKMNFNSDSKLAKFKLYYEELIPHNKWDK